MAKRFTCTQKWSKSFLKSLPAKYKLLWVYICDECDHAGIWDVELDIAGIRLDAKYNIQECKIIFNSKIISFDNDTKWFIPSFVIFQYGYINPINRVHKSIIERLKYYKIEIIEGQIFLDNFYKYYNINISEGASKPLASPSLGAKDKEKDKEKVIFLEGGVGGNKKQYHDFVWLSDAEYEKLCSQYGKDITDYEVENVDTWLGNKPKEKNRKNRDDYRRVLSFIRTRLKNEAQNGKRKKITAPTAQYKNIDVDYI